MITYGSDEMRREHQKRKSEAEAKAEAKKQELAAQPRELTVVQEVQQASTALNKSRRGRSPGALSKRVQEAREIVADTGLNPLRFLCLVARNRRLDIETRVRAAQATLPFIYPKLAVSHVTQERNESLEFQKIQILSRDKRTADLMEELTLQLCRITPDEAHDAMLNEPAAFLPEPASEPEPSAEGDEEDRKLFGE